MGETYQGWPNRETWGFMLIVNNDQRLQTQAYAIAGENPDRLDCADALQDWWDTYLELELSEGDSRAAVSTMQTVGSTWRIDWRPVADYLHRTSGEVQ